MTKTEQADLTQLRHNLNTYFDKGEIRSLCFDLSVDYDNLPEAKEDTIRELIRYLVRRQRIDALVAQCRQLRPHVSWSDIPPEEITALLYRPPATSRTLSKREMQERQKQLVLLEKVKNFWIKGVLEKSVPDTNLMDLGRQQHPDAVDHPWHQVVGTAIYDTHSLSAYKDILDTFVESDRALLILGGPGAGKTITLLELARELITLAEQDLAQPIPVVLNLSSWAESQAALIDWVVEELTTKYQIPRKMSRPWLENDDLLLLLDGLDQVPGKQRAACVNAINQFRTERGLTGLVVCSRSYEYEAIGARLKLGGAILLQTLTPAQVDDYLAAAGPQLSALRSAIQRDATLQEMAQSPLMLNVMSVAYSDIGAVDGDSDDDIARTLAGSSTPGETTAIRRQHLFAAYVRRMLQRHGDPAYTPVQTRQWLAWLAQRMSQHHQTIFLLEQIQPSWLASRPWRWLYLIVARLGAGFFIGIISWLHFLVLKQIYPERISGTWEQLVRWLHIPASYAELLPALLVLSTLGAIVGVIDGLYFERRNQAKQAGVTPKRDWRRTALVGLPALIFVTFPEMLFDVALFALLSGLMVGAQFAVSSYFLDGQSFRDEIRTVEMLGWSWSGSVKGMGLGLILGVVLGWIGTQLFDSRIGQWALMAPWLFFFLLGGMQNNRLETKNRPNQGIWLSARNCVSAALFFGLPLGLSTGVVLGTTSGLIAGLNLGLAAGLLYGGANVMKHFGVRLALWYNGRMPLNYVHFLNHAARHVLLYKVGGGYIFIHRLLQAYFAELDSTRGENE